MTDLPHIGVLGAGAIGTYLGVRLSAAAYPVTLVGRPWLAEAGPGLRAVGLDGREVAPGAGLVIATEPAALAPVDVCLVTVKSADTAAAGAQLAGVLDTRVPVVSMQNGLGNVERLRDAGVAGPIIAGMVTFNIVSPAGAGVGAVGSNDAPGPGVIFRKATSGPIMTGAEVPGALVEAFAAAGEPLEARADIAAVQTAKLLLNLNNGLCAATGLSIADSVRSRELRWCFAALLDEGIGVVRALEMAFVRIGPLAPPLVARLLRLPNWLFARLAGSFLRIDPSARSSTLQDLDRGKATEIDFLNGEIVALAARAGRAAPANAAVVAHIHALEAAAPPLPFWTPQQAKEAIVAALGGG